MLLSILEIDVLTEPHNQFLFYPVSSFSVFSYMKSITLIDLSGRF